MDKKTIIVTGACGFIGFYLVKQLQQVGYSVLAVDKCMSDEADFLIENGMEFLAMDLTKEEEFEKLPTGNVSAVINLACAQPANMATDEGNPATYLNTNVMGVAHLLNYCQKNNIKKMLHTISHRNVQGLWEKGEKITEDSPRAIKYSGKFAMFSISESAAADVIEYYHQQHGMNCVVFRLPSVYGFGHHENFFVNGKVVKTGLGVFIERAKTGQTIEVWGDSEKGRDVIYVKDVVTAILQAIKNESIAGLFNIASGKTLSLRSQVESIVKVFSPDDHRPQIVYRPEKPNSIDACSYDIRKAARVLGWQPQFSFEDMLIDYKHEMESGKLHFLLNRKHRMTEEQSSGT